MDSDHRSYKATDLQSAPFGHSGNLPYIVIRLIGAGGRIRTPDLLITNQLLYQLSYTSTLNSFYNISYSIFFVKPFFVIKIVSYMNDSIPV